MSLKEPALLLPGGLYAGHARVQVSCFMSMQTKDYPWPLSQTLESNIFLLLFLTTETGFSAQRTSLPLAGEFWSLRAVQ